MISIHHTQQITEIPTSRTGKTSGNTNPRGQKAPGSAIPKIGYKPASSNPTEEDWQLVFLSKAAGCQRMPIRLAEGMNRFLKDQRVIKRDPEEVSKYLETEKGKGKRKNSYYLRCSTIGRMKKKEKIIWRGITPYLSFVVSSELQYIRDSNY